MSCLTVSPREHVVTDSIDYETVISIMAQLMEGPRPFAQGGLAL